MIRLDFVIGKDCILYFIINQFKFLLFSSFCYIVFIIRKRLKLFRSKNNRVVGIDHKLFFKFIYILIKLKNINPFLSFIVTW
jgi:hypothetical protein